jgi:hypothetical protein
MVLLQFRSRSARFDAVVRITGYEGLLCLYWVRLVGLEGFEPPTHGLGNREVENPWFFRPWPRTGMPFLWANPVSSQCREEPVSGFAWRAT